jgi:hypothetical protein
MAATGTLGKLSVDLLLETLQWSSGLTKAEYDAQKFSENIEKKFGAITDKIGNSLKTMAAGFIAGLAVDRMVSFVDETQKLADTFDELSQKAGTSLEFMASMSVYAQTSGTSIEAVASAMGKFNKATAEALGDPSSQPGQVFAALNIELKNTDGTLKTSEQLFQEAAQALGEMEDGAIKSAAAQVLFGKSGAELIPTLNAQAKATDEMKAATKAYGDEMARLAPIAGALEEQQAIATTNARSMAAVVGQQLIPYFVTLVEQWNKATESGGALAGVGTVIMNAFKGIVIAIDAVLTTFSNLVTMIVGAYRIFERLKAGDVEGAKAEFSSTMQSMADSSADFEKRVAALVDPLNQFTKAAKDGKPPTDALTAAVSKSGDAAKKAADEWKRQSAAWVKSIDEQIEGEKKMAEASAKAIADRVTAEEKAAEEIFRIRMSAMEAEQRIQAEADAATQQYYRTVGDRRNKELEAQWGGLFKGVEDAGRQAFDAIFDHTEGGWESMLDTMAASFKRTLVDLVYQSFAKPLILNILAMMPGGLGQMASNQLGSLSGGGGWFGDMLSGVGSFLSGDFGGITSWAEGMMAGGIESILGGIGTAVPYLGAAFGIGNLLFGKGGVFDDPDAMRTATFGGGSMANESWRTSGAFGEFGFSNVAWGSEAEQGDTVRAFLAQMAQMDEGLANLMTEDQIGRATDRLAAFSAQYELGMEHEATNFGNITKDRLEVIAGAINEGLGAFVEGFEGPVEDILSVVESYLAATNGGQSIAEMIDAAAPQTAMEAYQSGLAALTEYVNGMDVSAESMATLTSGMDAFRQSTVAMVQAIDAASKAIHDSFAATAESITRDLLNPEQLYERLQSQTDALYEQLMTETDPATIQRLAEQINSNINEAWGMLDEGQQSALGDAYLERISEVDALVAEKMQALRDVVIEDAEGVMTTIADRLDVLFADAATTAATNRDAANTNLAAAQTPVRVVVDVDTGSTNGG